MNINLSKVRNPDLKETLEDAFNALNNIKGDIYYVDSNTGADTSGGKSWDNALATIDAAIGKCTANKGDVILVAPGHAENLIAAAAIDADVAGITIIGLGAGSNRPTLTFKTSTAADIDIDAANITFQNLYFDLTGIDGIVAAIDVNAADFTIKDCEFLMADSGGQAVNAITTAAAAHRMKVENCIFKSPDAGAEEAIKLLGAADGIIIKNCRIYGDFSVAPIHNPTGNIATNILILGNYLQNDQSGDLALELVSAVTGAIINNLLVTDAIATALDAGSCYCFGNLYFDSSDTDVSGTSIPTSVTAGGTDLDNIQNALYGDDVITTWPSPAYPANGVSIAEAIRYIADAQSGTVGLASFPAAAAAANDVSLAEVIRYIQESQIGTLVNSGGTATLGGIIGDPANSDLVTRIAAIQTDIGDPSGRTNLKTILALLGNPDTVGASIYDALAGANGLPSFPAAAAAANDVSIAEVIRYIQESQIGTLVNSGGTATLAGIIGDPANSDLVTRIAAIQADVGDPSSRTNLKTILACLGNPDTAGASIYDALAGSAGLPSFPAAAAPANDVSLAEVIRAIYDRQLGDGTTADTNNRLGKKVTRNAADIFAGTQIPLFTISGGKVLVTAVSIEVTTAAIDGSTSNTQVVTNPTVGTDAAMCATLDIAADEAGTIYSLTGEPATPLTGGSGGGAPAMIAPWIVAEGTIDILSSADVGTGGALGYCELWYIPLDTGASVAAA